MGRWWGNYDFAVSVLFSEPKIPQCYRRLALALDVPKPVSVLFSEPKIPQCFELQLRDDYAESFSALQRAENSSIVLFRNGVCVRGARGFSALQRAENSSIVLPQIPARIVPAVVSVLFSEPKIPQFRVVAVA